MFKRLDIHIISQTKAILSNKWLCFSARHADLWKVNYIGHAAAHVGHVRCPAVIYTPGYIQKVKSKNCENLSCMISSLQDKDNIIDHDAFKNESIKQNEST